MKFPKIRVGLLLLAAACGGAHAQFAVDPELPEYEPVFPAICLRLVRIR